MQRIDELYQELQANDREQTHIHQLRAELHQQEAALLVRRQALQQELAALVPESEAA